MAISVTLLCTGCAATSTHARVVPGAVAPCACGAALALPAPAIFGCPSCGVRSKAALLPLNTARPCPKCKTPLEVMAVSNAPTKARRPDSDLPTVVQTPPEPISDAPPLFTTWTPDGMKPDAGDSVATAHGSQPGAETLAAGSRFGRYQILRELARGGMGIVSIAHDPTLKREVALKVLIAGDLATPEAIARFVREARAAGQLRHPNIVAVHDAGEIDGRHFFTMDLIKGRELAKVITASDTDRETMIAWIRDVARAVHHAHEHGVIHRDLKPANIIIAEDGKPVVMDFGLAKDVSSQTFQSLSGSVFGTPAYMSPEQARGATHAIDRRSDVYSLGVILYEAATGARPFGGDTLFDTMRAVVNDEPLAPHSISPDIDADLDTVILRCLEKDPANRYQNAADFADDLERILAGEPVAARPVSPLVRMWRRARRRPALMVGSGAGVLILILLVVMLTRDGLLGRLQGEFASGDAQRINAATTLLISELREQHLTGNGRERGLALLRARIGGSESASEAAAISALAEFHDTSARTALLERACDGSAPTAVRIVAADATRALIDPATAVETAQRLASAVLTSTDPALAAGLTNAATMADVNTVVDGLGSAVSDANRDSRWRAGVVAAIGNARPSLHAASMNLLLRCAGDTDARVSDAAARSLELVRTRDVVLPIYGLEGKTSAAAAGLGRMAQAIAERDRLMNEELAAYERSDSPSVAIAKRLNTGSVDERLAAAYDLGRVGEAEAVTPLLRALNDPDGSVRRTAARALATLAAQHDIPSEAVLTALNTDDLAKRCDATYAAGLLGVRESIPTLAEHLNSTSERRELLAIIDALGRMGDTSVVSVLQTAWETALASTDTDLANSMITALAMNKAQNGIAYELLIKALEHSERSVREAALQALREVSGESFSADPARWRTWLAQTRP